MTIREAADAMAEAAANHIHNETDETAEALRRAADNYRAACEAEDKARTCQMWAVTEGKNMVAAIDNIEQAILLVQDMVGPSEYFPVIVTEVLAEQKEKRS